MLGKLDYYRIFKQVADKGNITSAARELFISQSAVSQSISNLEAILELKLFNRSKKGVTMTNEGKVLYDYVSNALSLLENGEEKLYESKKLTEGLLEIGISNTLTECFLLPYLNIFHKTYPGVRVRILNGTSKKVIKMLDSGQVDIAFATTSKKPKGYDSHLCFKTHTIFVASKDYPIDFRHVFSLKEIAELPLILLEREAGSRIFLEDCFLREGIRLHPEIELASYELLISLAQIGLGVSGITEEFNPDILENGNLVKLKLEKELPLRAVSMIRPANSGLSPAAAKFAQLIMDNTFEGSLYGEK